jgi:hypothetical protein
LLIPCGKSPGESARWIGIDISPLPVRPGQAPARRLHLPESESFFKRSHKVVVALTVQEILDEHIAKKLA